MALMFAIWSPQPNWIPRKPKLMFQICQNESGGLVIVAPPPYPSPRRGREMLIRGRLRSSSTPHPVLLRQPVVAAAGFGEGFQPPADFGGQRVLDVAPAPVAARAARQVHPPLAVHTQHVLEGHDRGVGHRDQEGPDEVPVDLRPVS